MKISLVGKSGKTSWIERVSARCIKTTIDENHCCGLQGFNPMLGDDCPACEMDHNLYEALKNYERI